MYSSTPKQKEPLLPEKHANEPEPVNSISNAAIKAIAVLRIGLGVTCLVAPHFGGTLFEMDVPAAYSSLTRMFGGRDLVLGVLLLTAGDNKLPDGGRHEIRRALWSGIATDVIDIYSGLIEFATGTSSGASAAYFVFSGSVAAIIGTVDLRHL
ncbi:hypothetical protein COCC4DRAFT_129791 [Bipolaris maydis ATCC 48331]|uniref:Uncharacterized protein n=2 Tax=Cochliobolus heterostrophus TaxID=5016 RepID=M2T3M2_COCH5|nr:uncharacterized protein COCC4DRAFT_129791 [Bipolaris maydis ATCC 48331]EMD92175.1 hypothetical protein COCHEDRAFT_1100079 [Bipolaris maydis C5]ENI07866.1 hypothetical protein COCC4DRAFT_129791 [Bipolaris maydis ATCC 48331]KAJ6272468.1 hypothetical protein PSV08DRAFT_370465 [Bipolaris maydis]